MEPRFVAVLRSGHPALRKKLTVASLAELHHLGISSSREDLTFVDEFLKVRKSARVVASDVPYLSAGAVLVQSNLVAILGRKLANGIPAGLSDRDQGAFPRSPTAAQRHELASAF